MSEEEPYDFGDIFGEPDEERRSAHELRVADEVRNQRARREARRLLDAEERPPAAIPEILTLTQRLRRPREPISYRIEGWQPTGSRVILAAQYKAGKTTLTGNLVRSLVDGDEFLGRDTVNPAGTVAVIDFEMDSRQLDTWLEDQHISRGDRVLVLPMRGNAAAFDLIDPRRRADWAGLLAGYGVQYVVLDCLRPVLDALGLDEHRDAGRFLVAFDALLAESGVGEAALVHHMGHSGERSRGDSRIRDWPDVEWRLVREDVDDPASPRYLSAFGRDVEQPEQRLEFDIANRHLSIAGGTRRDAKTERVLQDVLDVLDGEPGLSGRNLEDHDKLGHGRDAIRAALKYGIRQGHIRTEPGPRNATLHYPVREFAGVREQCATRGESECASSLLSDAHTHSLAAGTDSAPSARTRALNDVAVCCETRQPLTAKCQSCSLLPSVREHAHREREAS